MSRRGTPVMWMIARIEPARNASAPRRRPLSRWPAATVSASPVPPARVGDPPALAEQPAVLLGRPLVTFLAHLIATDRRVPQSRDRRRAEPQQAIAAYEAAANRVKQVSSERQAWCG